MQPSPRRALLRSGLALLAALLVLLAVAVPAGAHVSIKPGVAKKGSFSVFSFSVPNERSTASTVELEVTFPTDHPIAFGRDSRPGGGVAVNGDREAGGRG